MIIQIGTEVDESIVLWKHKESDEWERADIDDLICAYENRPRGKWENSEDCISRQQAIEEIALHDCTNGEVPYFTSKGVQEILNILPPVKPKPVCEDAISRQALIDEILEDGNGAVLSYPAGMYEDELVERIEKQMIEHLIGVIEYASPVEPKRPKGEWVYAKEQLEIVPMWECSCCRIRVAKKFNFCPHCGADMRGEK